MVGSAALLGGGARGVVRVAARAPRGPRLRLLVRVAGRRIPRIVAAAAEGPLARQQERLPLADVGRVAGEAPAVGDRRVRVREPGHRREVVAVGAEREPTGLERGRLRRVGRGLMARAAVAGAEGRVLLAAEELLLRAGVRHVAPRAVRLREEIAPVALHGPGVLDVVALGAELRRLADQERALVGAVAAVTVDARAVLHRIVGDHALLLQRPLHLGVTLAAESGRGLLQEGSLRRALRVPTWQAWQTSASRRSLALPPACGVWHATHAPPANGEWSRWPPRRRASIICWWQPPQSVSSGRTTSRGRSAAWGSWQARQSPAGSGAWTWEPAT